MKYVLLLRALGAPKVIQVYIKTNASLQSKQGYSILLTSVPFVVSPGHPKIAFCLVQAV